MPTLYVKNKMAEASKKKGEKSFLACLLLLGPRYIYASKTTLALSFFSMKGVPEADMSEEGVCCKIVIL